jgi:hypothetical protein
MGRSSPAASWISGPSKPGGAALHRPGKPTQNALIESFNGKFRDECLNQNWFVDLRHAREVIEDWRVDYNTVRPHSSWVSDAGRICGGPCSDVRRSQCSVNGDGVCLPAVQTFQATGIRHRLRIGISCQEGGDNRIRFHTATLNMSAHANNCRVGWDRQGNPVGRTITIHHKDGNHENDSPSNKTLTHCKCHRSHHMRLRWKQKAA